MVKSIAIVSLSRGIVGEPFMQFEVEIGLRRLRELGLNVKFTPHALKGLVLKRIRKSAPRIYCRRFAIRTST